MATVTTMNEQNLPPEGIGTCRDCALRLSFFDSDRVVCPVTDMCADDFFCKAWVKKEETE